MPDEPAPALPAEAVSPQDVPQAVPEIPVAGVVVEAPVEIPQIELALETAPIASEPAAEVPPPETKPLEATPREVLEGQGGEAAASPHVESVSGMSEELPQHAPSQPVQEEKAHMRANESIPTQSEPISIPAPSSFDVTQDKPATPRAGRQLALKSRESARARARKKLDRILALLQTKNVITGGDAQKLLRAPKSTATRYLNRLEREGSIIQVGTRGRGVRYIKAQ